MGYSDDPRMVRVDFFKESGKWGYTEAVEWTGNNYAPGSRVDGQMIHDAFAQSLRDHFKDRPNRLSDLDAVCLKPYHEHAHPIQFKHGAWLNYGLRDSPTIDDARITIGTILLLKIDPNTEYEIYIKNYKEIAVMTNGGRLRRFYSSVSELLKDFEIKRIQ